MDEKLKYPSVIPWMMTVRAFSLLCLVFLPCTDVAVALPQGVPSIKASGFAVDAGDWPSWPIAFSVLGTGSAASGSPPTQWAEKTAQGPSKNIAWKVEIPGLGSSSPIVGDRIYLRAQHHLYCIAECPDPIGEPDQGLGHVQHSDYGRANALTTELTGEPFSYRRIGSLGTAVERTASISAGDVDSDGDLDLVVANGRHWAGQNYLYGQGELNASVPGP